ncbi:MAG: lytic transglycosylase domain-containing protein, partial [Candidatus Wallbacteria bacterium]|nr:lytic transglycosylase domain-containing protein [Candidatus Wallbacteria bacterium]
MKYIIFLMLLLAVMAQPSLSLTPEETLSIVETYSDASEEDELLWRQYVAGHRFGVEQISDMIRDAAQEFSVPVSLLEAVAYVESNFTQIGPSIDRGWGVMHLVDNDYCSTLIDAARLIGLDPQQLKDDPRANIRGAAALLSCSANNSGVSGDNLEDWIGPLKALTGLAGDELQELQVHTYMKALADGISEYNL